MAVLEVDCYLCLVVGVFKNSLFCCGNRYCFGHHFSICLWTE